MRTVSVLTKLVLLSRHIPESGGYIAFAPVICFQKILIFLCGLVPKVVFGDSLRRPTHEGKTGEHGLPVRVMFLIKSTAGQF